VEVVKGGRRTREDEEGGGREKEDCRWCRKLKRGRVESGVRTGNPFTLGRPRLGGDKRGGVGGVKGGE